MDILDSLTEYELCRNLISGPTYFFENYYHLEHSDSVFMKYKYTDALLKNIHKNKLSINVLSRQMSKTTTVSGYALWLSIFLRNSNILIISANTAQAEIAIRAIRYAISKLPTYFYNMLTVSTKNKLTFYNDSTIEAISWSSFANKSRGQRRQYSLIALDDYGHYTNVPVITQQCMPTIASAGKVIITSSAPTSETHELAYLLKQVNRSIWSVYTANITNSPIYSKEWELEQRALLGNQRFEAEYMIEVT